MKKLLQTKFSLAVVAVLFQVLLLNPQKLIAQSCNQIDIVYQDLDCGGKEDHPDVGGSNGGNCLLTSACEGKKFNYSATSGVWTTFNWTVTGPAVATILPNNTSQNISIVWPAQGTYTLTITATDPSGNIYTKCLTVVVKPKPLANFTFSPNNVCAGSTISFTNTTTAIGGVAYTWNFGDPASGANNFSTAINPTHTFSANGVYTVTLVAASFVTVTVPGGANGQETTVIKTCCADTIQKQVTIVPGSITIECVSTVCAGTTSTYTAVGCANPTWLPPTGGTITGQSGNQVTIQWGNGTLQGVINVQCPGGCIASVPVPIIPTNPQPTGNFNPCNNATTSYTMPVLPGTFYTWHLDDLTPTNYDYLLSTYPDNNTVWINWNLLPPGTYQLTVELDNKHLCCESIGKVTIISNSTFTAYSDQTVCKGTAASLSVFPVAGTFNWVVTPSLGVSPSSGTGSTFSPVFSNAGNYIVTVTETANTYCNSNVSQQVKVNVVSVPTPGVINGPTTVCPGSQNTYTMSTVAPLGFYYDWAIVPPSAGSFQPGNMTNASGNSATILWTSLSAVVTATLQRINYPLCAANPVQLPVNQATIGTISGQTNVCVDAEEIYTLTGGNLPPGENVQWTINLPSLGSVVFGQGTNSPKIKWHGLLIGTGPWTATITATSNCGATSTNVLISKKPIVTLSQSGNICLPGGVTLTATGAGTYTYLWSNGATTATTSVNTIGFHTVTVTNGSCSITKSIEVKDPFLIRPRTCGVGYCNGTNTNEQLGVEVLKPGSGTFTYAWYSGVYPSGTLMTTTTNILLSNSYTATSPGTYYVVVTYGSCQKTAAFTVKKVCCPDINTPAITNVTQLTCNQYTFTGTTPNPSGASITWNFGDGVTQAGVSGVPVTHTYSNAGIYCVTFCVGPPTPNPTACTGNCATATAVVPIEANFSYTLGCNGCISITDLSEIYCNSLYVSYFWDFGDGFTSTSVVPPAHCYSTAGTYTLSLTLTYNDGLIAPCTSTHSVNVTYTPLSIAMNTPVCTGQLVNMSSSPGGFDTYTWDFGDTYSSYTSPTTHAYTQTGPITVTLSVTDQLGNTCTANSNINVFQGVSNCTLQPGYICPGDVATLTAATGVGYTYVWEEFVGGNFVPPTPNSITNTLSVATPGFYHVIISNANGCKCTSNLVEVKAVTKPKAIMSVSPSTQICGSGNVLLTSVNALPGYTSDWYQNGNFGTLLGTGNSYYAFGVNTTTNFTLIVTNEYGCKDTCTMTIFVNPLPIPPNIVSSPSGVLCEGAPITLTVTNYASNIIWNTGATTNSIVVTAAGVYTATYTNPITGCTSKKNILVNRKPSVALFPHYCDSIPCECVRPFSIYAPLPLVGPGAVTYSIQWYNPALVGSGPVLNNVNTGSYYIVMTDPSTGCSSTSQTYTVVVPPCDTCNCEGSHWEFITLEHAAVPVKAGNVNKNIIVEPPIKLECKANYSLECNKPYTIKSGFVCADTSCPSKVTYKLVLPDNSVQTGNVPVTFTPAQTGTYTLTLYGWCGNTICDSCYITFNVQCKPECDCKGSKWEFITLQKSGKQDLGKKSNVNNNVNPIKKLECNGGYSLECKVPYTVNAGFICNDPSCPPKVTYKLVLPDNSIQTGAIPFTFTPAQSGAYVLTMYGWCGNTICDSCLITFKVDCKIDCNCNNSHWGEILLTKKGNTKAVKCGEFQKMKCNEPFTFNATYLCADPSCQSSVSYVFTPPIGSPITGTLPFTYTPTIAGVYTLELSGMCGNVVCDKCVFDIQVECPPIECCPHEKEIVIQSLGNTITQQSFGGNAFSLFTGNISIAGGPSPYQEIKATVLDYQLIANYEECIPCKNKPFTWSSLSAGLLTGIVPTTTGAMPTIGFNIPANPTENPREVVWQNGAPIYLNTPQNTSIQLYLPASSLLPCCSLKAKVCIKFTFKDTNCKVCEKIVCGTILISKGEKENNKEQENELFK